MGNARLESISQRITALTLSAGLPSDVWRELCAIDGSLRMLLSGRELKERAAQSASAERVRSVVIQAIDGATDAIGVVVRYRIADRVASQLAVPVLSAEERALLYQMRDAQLSALSSIGHLGDDVCRALNAKFALLERLLGAKP
jgi:hypothetical protein